VFHICNFIFFNVFVLSHLYILKKKYIAIIDFFFFLILYAALPNH
jgi:hypothetical protein